MYMQYGDYKMRDAIQNENAREKRMTKRQSFRRLGCLSKMAS